MTNSEFDQFVRLTNRSTLMKAFWNWSVVDGPFIRIYAHISWDNFYQNAPLKDREIFTNYFLITRLLGALHDQ